MRNNNFYRGGEEQNGATGWEDMASERSLTARERVAARLQRSQEYAKARRKQAFARVAKKAAVGAAAFLLAGGLIVGAVASSGDVSSRETSDNVFENEPYAEQIVEADSLTFHNGAFVRTETRVSEGDEVPNYVAQMPKEDTVVDVSEYNVYLSDDPQDKNGAWIGVGARKDGDPNGQTFAEKLASEGYTSEAKAESAGQNDKDGVVWSAKENVTVNKK